MYESYKIKEAENVDKGRHVIFNDDDELFISESDYVNLEARKNEIAFIPYQEFESYIVDGEFVKASNGDYSYTMGEIITLVREEVEEMSDYSQKFKKALEQVFSKEEDYKSFAEGVLYDVSRIKGPLSVSILKKIQEEICSLVLGD